MFHFHCELALLTITQLETFRLLLLDPLNINYGLRVARRYHQHETVLHEAGLIEPIRAGNVRFVSSYFAIRKSSGGLRSIFNGRRLAERCTVPPTVNLPEIPEMMRIISELHQDVPEDSPTVLSCDFRHWFHQVPMAPSIRDYFALQFKGGSYVRWKCLPMAAQRSGRRCRTCA